MPAIASRTPSGTSLEASNGSPTRPRLRGITTSLIPASDHLTPHVPILV